MYAQVTKQICTDTQDTCEVYMKRGAENGVSTINTCSQYDKNLSALHCAMGNGSTVCA